MLDTGCTLHEVSLFPGNPFWEAMKYSNQADADSRVAVQRAWVPLSSFFGIYRAGGYGIIEPHNG